MRTTLRVSLMWMGCCMTAAHAQETQSDERAPVMQENPASTTQTDSQPSKPKSALRADRLDLETTIVTGNRELPRVLYIVPWKKAEIGELPAQPFNTLLDEVLAPVDRDVFKREVKYFHTVTRGDAVGAKPTNGANASP